ncbi:MAG: DUF364 domain-containing protein [Proteobacteria bacterium]|nr:DUF364 domain-containing protein [Pseudomonadota bacterium]
MTVRERIRKQVATDASRVNVQEVRIGLGYTAVMLENGQTGVAFTFQEKMPRGCSVLGGLHPLSGRKASDLLALMDSSNRVETAVGLATVNALANTLRSGLLEGDAMEYLRIGPDDTVGMVGYFGPVLPRLREITPSILIFEQDREREGELLPEKEAYRLLPQCQVAMITSTSILNHTIDRLLDAVGSCREVVLLGASTPLVKEAFSDTPVTFLSGVVVTNPEEILRIVSEGGGVRLFRENIRKVNLALKKRLK